MASNIQEYYTQFGAELNEYRTITENYAARTRQEVMDMKEAHDELIRSSIGKKAA